MTAPTDQLQRPLRDLRISVTDRCNFRCRYCMPRESFDKSFQFLPKARILTFEEIERVARSCVGLGVRKLRITGGEPLVRRDIARLVRLLAALDVDLSMTSNGSLLAQHAAALRQAGLARLTVSVDSLRPERFASITDSNVSLTTVLSGIHAAIAAGFAPPKINMVVRRGFNDDELVEAARYFCERGHSLRFIEYMDVGETNGWRQEQVVTKREILERLARHIMLEPVAAGYRGEVASRYRAAGLPGEIGIISSVSEPFCGDCTRMRLSAEGSVYTCLFASTGTDLRSLLRVPHVDDDQLRARILGIWQARHDRYSERRGERTLVPLRRSRVEMSHIGG